jgi:hypothetical protein
VLNVVGLECTWESGDEDRDGDGDGVGDCSIGKRMGG